MGSNYKAPTQVAPPSNERLGSGPEDTLKERVPEIGDDLQTQGTDVSTLASTDSPIPPLARNVVLEFGDLIGERVARAALNRAAAFGEERVDPRAVVAVERAAVAKLQNPRVVSGTQRVVNSLSHRTFRSCDENSCKFLRLPETKTQGGDKKGDELSSALVKATRSLPYGNSVGKL